jgi:hypothetical protein
MKTESNTCADCATDITHGCGTGYATFNTGEKVCYSCADKRQSAQIVAANPGDKFQAYVSSDGKKITTWTGGELMRVCRWGNKHAWSGRGFYGPRHYINAIDSNGRMWYGTGAKGMYANIKLSKS